MNRKLVLMGVLVFTFFTIGVMNNRHSQIKESITYFPIDPNVTFTSSNTSIHFFKPQKSDKYILKWQIESLLDRKAYLRQDVGFLFSNGRLIAKQGIWKQNKAQLIQERQIVGRDPALIQALSFHYAELHENQEKIFSSQKMSVDQIYVINPQDKTFHSFRNAFSKQEQEWKQKLDQQTKESLYHSWEKGIRYFSINPEQYFSFPLTDLFLKPTSPFPGFSEQETNQLIGNLWEGLYKNYFLGIKKADGTIIKPIGSTIPLILIANDKSHLLVLTETANGEPTLLRQKIEYGH